MAGAFDDLLPDEKKAKGGAFADLVPASVSAGKTINSNLSSVPPESLGDFAADVMAALA